jgi:WD40 repeat protein
MMRELKGHVGNINHAVFSPDGSRIVTASWDDTARVWDVATGTMNHELKGHKLIVNHAAFSPDGSLIVTASSDDTAWVWDVATGTMIHELKGHKDDVNYAVFSPDGSRIVTASSDKIARVWNNSPRTPDRDKSERLLTDNNGRQKWTIHPPFSQGLFERARQMVSRHLTDQERKEILMER